MQLVELQAVVERMRAIGWGLAAITKDEPAILSGFGREHAISYPLLAGRTLIERLGLADPAFANDVRRSGAPTPVMLLVDDQGRILRRFFEADRWTLPSVLARVGGVTAPGDSRWTNAAQVNVRAWAPSPTVRPGQRVSLAVDLAPLPRMHVYAPGKHAYTPVSLVLSATAMAQPLGVDFPESENYTFKPLNETVPVYTRQVTLFQDVHVSSDAPAGSMVIRASVTTQACDDEICYPERRTPIEWRITVER